MDRARTALPPPSLSWACGIWEVRGVISCAPPENLRVASLHAAATSTTSGVGGHWGLSWQMRSASALNTYGVMGPSSRMWLSLDGHTR